MKVRLRIEALSIEADWLRAGRADFVDALRAALERELGEMARRGDFTTGRRTARRGLAIPAPVLVSPQTAGQHIARAVGGEIAPRERPAAPGRRRRS